MAKHSKGGHVIHGHARQSASSSEYSAWENMRARCRNLNAPNYERYGGRGITVCERWSNFNNFLADMGLKPTSEHSLERVNNNGNYEPSNCRWATTKEQAYNKRNNRMLTIDGVTQCAAAWAIVSGIGLRTIYYRLDRGWTPKEAVFVPSIPRELRGKGGTLLYARSNYRARQMAR